MRAGNCRGADPARSHQRISLFTCYPSTAEIISETDASGGGAGSAMRGYKQDPGLESSGQGAGGKEGHGHEGGGGGQGRGNAKSLGGRAGLYGDP